MKVGMNGSGEADGGVIRSPAPAPTPGKSGRGGLEYVEYVVRIESREFDLRPSTSRRAKFAKMHALRPPFTRKQLYGVQGVAGSNPAVPTAENVVS